MIHICIYIKINIYYNISIYHNSYVTMYVYIYIHIYIYVYITTTYNNHTASRQYNQGEPTSAGPCVVHSQEVEGRAEKVG